MTNLNTMDLLVKNVPAPLMAKLVETTQAMKEKDPSVTMDKIVVKALSNEFIPKELEQ